MKIHTHRAAISAALLPVLAVTLLGARAARGEGPAPAPAGETRIPVTFAGGHETDPRDRGRPVVLIAAALGVPADVFRAAFRNVTPAPAGREPDPEQVR